MLEPDGRAHQAGLDSVPCGYLATNAAGLILEVNGTLLELLDCPADQLVGLRSFTDLLTAGGRIYHETHYRPTLDLHGEAREIALDLRRADGERIPVLVTSVFDRDAAEGTGSIRTALFKATDRRGYERELLAARQRAEASEREALAIARTLQRTLIPRAPASISGLGVSVAFRPAGDGGLIGGDFFDIFELESGDWIVLIGDVSGKGIDAAAVATLVRRTVQAEAAHTREVDEVLRAVNRVLLDDETDRYCTIVLARLAVRPGAAFITLCSAGHPLPLLRRRSDAPITLGRPGSVVGGFADPVYHPIEVELGAGDVLVLYTDGVTDGRRNGEFFGEDRLLSLVGRTEADALPAAIVDAAVDFQAGFSVDDIAVIALSVPTS